MTLTRTLISRLCTCCVCALFVCVCLCGHVRTFMLFVCICVCTCAHVHILFYCILLRLKWEMSHTGCCVWTFDSQTMVILWKAVESWRNAQGNSIVRGRSWDLQAHSTSCPALHCYYRYNSSTILSRPQLLPRIPAAMPSSLDSKWKLYSIIFQVVNQSCIPEIKFNLVLIYFPVYKLLNYFVRPFIRILV